MAPTSLSDTVASSAKVGVACGAVGFLFGGTAGIVKGVPPVLFGGVSALQSFALGATYWSCRSTILHAWTPQHQTPSDLVKASAISGGITGGAVGLLTRGRSHAIPGAIMFTVFGFLGQIGYNAFTVERNVDVKTGPGFWKRMSEKSFSPVKIMSDQEYADMLNDKILKLDVEIAILDDRIAALRKEQQNEGVEKTPSTGVEK